MTESEAYKQQIEAGKEIVQQILRDVARVQNEPWIASLSFAQTQGDFDANAVSLVDPQTHKVVTKFKIAALADLPAMRGSRGKMELYIRSAVRRA
jgi:hypothetical protein